MGHCGGYCCLTCKMTLKTKNCSTYVWANCAQYAFIALAIRDVHLHRTSLHKQQFIHKGLPNSHWSHQTKINNKKLYIKTDNLENSFKKMPGSQGLPSELSSSTPVGVKGIALPMPVSLSTLGGSRGLVWYIGSASMLGPGSKTTFSISITNSKVGVHFF